MTTAISDTLRDTFRGLADLLIPKTETMPSGSEIGVHGPVLDKIVGLRPDIEPHFIRGPARATTRSRLGTARITVSVRP